MKRYLNLSVLVITVWALASFVGVMFDTERAGFWTQSLMTALLLGALLAPLRVFFKPSGAPNPSQQTQRSAASRFDNQQRPDFVGGRAPSGSFSEQWPYVNKDEYQNVLQESDETVKEHA